jgi:predicted Ser/Thr protein kinase
MKSTLTEIETPQGKLKVIRLLGKGKSGYSYLTENSGQCYVLKLMHDEPCTYYAFSENKVKTEINAYHFLKDAGITIPTLIHHDLEKEYLLKEYIDGPTAADWLIKGGRIEAVLTDLFQMSKRAQQHGINIDYFPTNFVIKSHTLYYVDYEINEYSEEWNLHNWGLYYWANPTGLKAYFDTKDALAINQNVDNGKPIMAPFIETVDRWIEDYS